MKPRNLTISLVIAVTAAAAVALISVIILTVTRSEEGTLVSPGLISNNPPVADAGIDQEIQEDRMVALNGTNSSDPDTLYFGGNLRFSWSQKDDTANTTKVDLIGEDTATPIFIAPSINDNLTTPLILTFELRVTDDSNSSSYDTVSITVHDSPKIEVNAIKKLDHVNIDAAGSNDDEGSTTTNTTVTLLISGFGSTIIEDTVFPMDIVFAIDSSSSMKNNDPGNLRLEATKLFLDNLNRTQDRAGLVSWDTEVIETFGLTSDYEILETLIDQTTLGLGTNLDTGLRGAIEILDLGNTGEVVIGNNNSRSKAIVFLTDGEGEYTPSSSNLTESQKPIVDEARDKGYRIFSIGLNIQPESKAENNLIDMASATGGAYLSSPTAENLDEVFNAILQTLIKVSSSAPASIDVIEVTESYIEGEVNYSIEPTSIIQSREGRTVITWSNIAQHVGDKDGRLTEHETFIVTFSVESSKVGNALPVNSEQSLVTYLDALGNKKRVPISQAYLNVK